MKTPDSNPKTAFGLTKPQLHLVPPVATQMEAAAMLDGAEKYGPYNWRQSAVSVSTYVSAARRHIDAYWDGENIVPDSKNKAHHLAAVRACMAIILDAMTHETLIDDRPGVQERKERDNDMLDAVKYANAGAASSSLDGLRDRDISKLFHPNGRQATVDRINKMAGVTEEGGILPGPMILDTRTPEQCRDDHAAVIRKRDEATKQENMDRATGEGKFAS